MVKEFPVKRESVPLQRLIVLNNVDIDTGITGSGPTKPVVELIRLIRMLFVISDPTMD